MDIGERQFEPGIARVEPPFDPLDPQGGDDTMYYHTDHLGTTRLMSDSSGYAATGWHSTGGGPTDVTPSVFTAFGEPITGPLDGESNRYGYVGAHGYQAHDEMPFLHVGHRYYDPGSGRFLQRDPIGIYGGRNVFLYASATPTRGIDPTGLSNILGEALNDLETAHVYSSLSSPEAAAVAADLAVMGYHISPRVVEKIATRVPIDRIATGITSTIQNGMPYYDPKWNNIAFHMNRFFVSLFPKTGGIGTAYQCAHVPTRLTPIHILGGPGGVGSGGGPVIY